MNTCNICLCLDKPLLTPNETIVFVGDTVIFTCTISGKDVSFTWETEPETDLEFQPKGSFNSTSGNTTANLELQVNSTYYNGMKVRCHVLLSNGDLVESEFSFISVQGYIFHYIISITRYCFTSRSTRQSVK